MIYFVHIYAILLLYAVYICYFRTGVSEQAVGTLKMGPKRCSETSVRIYHSRLRKKPKREQISLTLRRNPEMTQKFRWFCLISSTRSHGVLTSC
jgi:hypothetical protein